MATVTKTELMTAEEFMAADLGDGTFELVCGDVVELTPPWPELGLVCKNVVFVLESYGRQSGSGTAMLVGFALRSALACRRCHRTWPSKFFRQEIVSPR